MSEALTQGVHHVGLAVENLDQTVDFFCKGLGWKEVGRNPAYPSAFVNDGTVTVTLWQVADPQTATRFDRRKNIGLHHLALAVTDLPGVFEKVRAYPGVVVEFAPQPTGPDSPRSHFICAIPGGIRVEFATRAPAPAAK